MSFFILWKKRQMWNIYIPAIRSSTTSRQIAHHVSDIDGVLLYCTAGPAPVWLIMMTSYTHRDSHGCLFVLLIYFFTLIHPEFMSNWQILLMFMWNESFFVNNLRLEVLCFQIVAKTSTSECNLHTNMKSKQKHSVYGCFHSSRSLLSQATNLRQLDFCLS